MKKTRNRILSVFLSLCVAVSCIVVMNVAAGAETAVPANGSAADDGGKYYVGFSNATVVSGWTNDSPGHVITSLFDGNGSTKICGKMNTSTGATFEFDAAEAFVPGAYYMRTADGVGSPYNLVGRNPKSWTIYGSNDKSAWTQIAAVNNDITIGNATWTAYKFSFDNASNTAYRYFRLVVSAKQGANGSDNDNLELSEFYMSELSDPVAKVGETEYTDFSAALSNWSEGSTLTLLDDVTTSSTISVSGTKTLDLDGYGITMTGSGSVISVGSGANLTLNDSDTSTTHKYTIASPKSNGAGLATVDDTYGTMTFTGGYITGGNISGNGGGVNVIGGTFTINGGTLIGNKATGTGGGIYIDDTNNTIGKCIMNGGSIIGNMAGSNGDPGGGAGVAIYNGYDKTETAWNTFIMNNGEICYNYTECVVGGGIRSYDNSKCEVNGGTVAYNYAKECGAGIGEGHLFISGSPVIKDNYVNGGKERNIVLYNSSFQIFVIGELNNAEPYGVAFHGVKTGKITNSTTTSYNDASKFKSDDEAYKVIKNADGQLELVENIDPVAKVGDTEYTDFSAALSNWSTGSTLTLLDDVTTSSTITVTGTRAIDLNGHNINSSVETAISVSSGAELTISGSGKISNLILNQGTLNFNDAEVSAITTQGGLTNINSGKINAPRNWTALNSNNNGQVNISGGTIYAESWRCVHAKNGTANISGGIFQCSVAPLTTEGTGKIILSGGYFPENINSATYTLADGYTLVDSDDTSKGAKMVCVASPVAKVGDTEYTDFSTALNNWTDGTTLTLLDDVTISQELIVPSGTTKICLNGHKMTTGKHILINSGNMLEIYDEGGGGSIDAQYRVGSMFWINGGKLTINGGTINGNVSTAGIIDIAANAVFTLNGGKITGQSTGRYDASVIRFTGSNGTFTMTGGEISGTTTRGGVTYFEKTDVTINISGNAKITNNKLESGSTQNLYLPTGVKINIAGALDTDANISITMQTPGVFTNSADTSLNDPSNFTSDDKTYSVLKNASGQLELAEPVPLTDSFIQAIEDQTYTGEAIEPALTVKNGETALTADTDYTAEYSDNINAGTATVTITGIGIYTGTAQATFTIVPAVSSEISGSTGSTSVTVSGLEEEARAVLAAEGGNSVNVTMQVENASESSAAGSGSISSLAPDKKLTFFEITVEKTRDSVKTLMSETTNILEIAVPYAYTGKRDVQVYRYHGNNAVALTQSDSRADGTFRVDEANGMVYIYANKFSTYAIGYTPYYSISGSAALAGYTGKVQAKLTASNGSIAADLGEVSLSELKFSNMTKGTYTLTLTWTDGKENNIMIPITLD